MKRTPVVIVVCVVAFILFNLLVQRSFTGLRWDLTENQLYTLSEGSKSILAKLDKEIELTFYLSEEITKDLPALRAYARRVQELLQEFEQAADGKLVLRVVDPKPFSEQEDEANLAGLQAVPVGTANDSLFFGLVGQLKEPETDDEANPFDGESPLPKVEIIPFFQPDKEQYLEYTLSQLIFNLNREAPPLVGIISALNVNGGVDIMRRTQQPPWMFMQFVEQLFDVEFIDTPTEKIDDNVDVLLLIHPKNLAEQTLFAIDQFALQGGRVVVFVDPVAEQDLPMQMMADGQPGNSDLAPLLNQWGVKLREEAVLGDFQNSLVVGVGPQRQPVRHIGMISIGQDDMAVEDIVLSGLETINFSSVGILDKVEEARETVVTPLVLSSTESNVLEAIRFGGLSNPQDLLVDFEPSGERYMLAARIEGKANTAYPQGIEVEEEASKEEADIDEASAAGDNAGVESEAGNEAGEEAAPELVMRTILPKAESTEDLNVVVVADTDVLGDRLWVQVQEFFGQRIASPWANNGDLLVNILDNLSGNADLIDIRSRGQYSRPFEVVETLRREAEANFADQQKELEASLQETEARLSELQQLRQGDDNAMLSPEQEQALLSFQQEKLKIRKALREVQRGLDQNIENLGSKLKLINIGLVPLLLTVAALVFAYWRRRQKAG